MRQFILPEDWDGGDRCRVEGGRARYVARVLRLVPGDTFPGRDAGGKLWDCAILESEPGRLLLSVSPAAGPREPDGGIKACSLPRIFLAQAVPKGAKMDLVVRQATEAGVTTVVPIRSSRVVRVDVDGASRIARWERIVREARQQSGSAIATEVTGIMDLRELPAALESRGLGSDDPRILLHESPLAQSSMHEYLTEAPKSVALCVGPEGGFSRDEVDYLLSEGFKPLRLAGAILRAETAALYAVAAAQIILSERDSWIPKSQ